MKRNSYEVLEAVTRKFVPDDINLFPRIATKVHNRKSSTQLHLKIGLIVCLILVVILSLLMTVPNIAMAMHRLFGFIPIGGIVDQSVPLRVLAEPVSKSQNDITVTVDDAILSMEKTVILFTVEGVGWEMLSHDENNPGCTKNPEVHLPDGTSLDAMMGSSEGQSNRFVFSPIPVGVNDANFIIPCISNTIPGKTPENWILPLHFAPAPSNMTILPVIELSPSPQIAKTTTVSQNPLSLDKVIELGDSYILIGSFRSISLPDGMNIDASMQPIALRFTDAEGNDVNAEYSSDIDFIEQSVETSSWAYKITDKYIDWPLKITLETAMASFSGQPIKEEFNAGVRPTDGQVWDINKDYEIDGYQIHLDSIQLQQNSYKFKFRQVDPRIANIGVWFEGFTSVGGGGGTDNQGNFDLTLIYEDAIPTGELTMGLSILAIYVPGSWSVYWQPDVLPTSMLNSDLTPTPYSCLNNETLDQLTPLPVGMIGKILFYEPMENGQDWGITLSNLDGSQKQIISNSGNWAELSMDGNHVVFSEQAGLSTFDIPTGKFNSLGVGDVVPDVFVTSSDGTSLKRITDDSINTYAVVGWSPDSMKLYITRLGINGFILQAVDMRTGSVKDLFTLENSSLKAPFASISPNGKWVAYRDTNLSSLYLARLDDSEMRLLIHKPGVGISGAIWSGDWLALKILVKDNNKYILLQPETCQVFLLNRSQGEIQGLFLPW
jgi:hypothetical protein